MECPLTDIVVFVFKIESNGCPHKDITNPGQKIKHSSIAFDEICCNGFWETLKIPYAIQGFRNKDAQTQ